MFLFLMLTTIKFFLFGFASEPLGVLVCAVALIGGAGGLRRVLKWNEEMANKAQDLARELTEKTIS